MPKHTGTAAETPELWEGTWYRVASRTGRTSSTLPDTIPVCSDFFCNASADTLEDSGLSGHSMLW